MTPLAIAGMWIGAATLGYALGDHGIGVLRIRAALLGGVVAIACAQLYVIVYADDIRPLAAALGVLFSGITTGFVVGYRTCLIRSSRV